MTVSIHPADLDDPRVATLLGAHLAEMEPTAPPESRHALSEPGDPFGAYRPDRHSVFLTLAL